MSISDKIKTLRGLLPQNVTLVAVSKTHPAEDIMAAYEAGQRVFGENRHAEMTTKYYALPKDIEWHFIGSVQRKNVKYIAPYVAMIHSVESVELLETIDKEARKCGRVIDVLLEVHVAREEAKHGFSAEEFSEFLSAADFSTYPNVRVRGVMGMATYTDDLDVVRAEFNAIKSLFDSAKSCKFASVAEFDTISMGMSGDWQLAVECGSTMVRVGSYIFGERNYNI